VSELADGRFFFAASAGILVGLFLSVLYFVAFRKRRYLHALVASGAGALGLGYDAVLYATGILPMPVFRGTLVAFAAFSIAVAIAVGISLSQAAGARRT
jgi:uncharacterized membrane protein YhfC